MRHKSPIELLPLGRNQHNKKQYKTNELKMFANETKIDKSLSGDDDGIIPGHKH